MKKLTEDYLIGIITACEIEQENHSQIKEQVKQTWSFYTFEGGVKVVCNFVKGFYPIETATDRGTLIDESEQTDFDYFKILSSEPETKFVMYVQGILENLANLF